MDTINLAQCIFKLENFNLGSRGLPEAHQWVVKFVVYCGFSLKNIRGLTSQTPGGSGGQPLVPMSA